jgi:hypothetical protein
MEFTCKQGIIKSSKSNKKYKKNLKKHMNSLDLEIDFPSFLLPERENKRVDIFDSTDPLETSGCLTPILEHHDDILSYWKAYTSNEICVEESISYIQNSEIGCPVYSGFALPFLELVDFDLL